MRKLDRAKQALARLEQLRAQLEGLVMEKRLHHPDVLALSQQIDEALNEYNRANEVWKGLQRDFPDKRYGIDFVNLGTKPGAQVLLQKMVTSVAEASAGADFFGSKLETLPLMSEFKTIKDAKAIATFTNGTPDRDYVKHIADPLKMPFIFCSGIGGIPAVMPLYGMDVQSLSHLLLVVLLIIGNISYVITHKQRLWR